MKRKFLDRSKYLVIDYKMKFLVETKMLALRIINWKLQYCQEINLFGITALENID